MNNPSWDVFRSQDNQEIIFEKDVARRLFCHEAAVEPGSLTCPPQYPGIENVPIQTASGEWVAFQAKHSQNGSQNGNAFQKLRKAIKPVQDGEYQLDKIYCFSSGVAPDTTTALTAEQGRVVADLKAAGISVEWYYADRILTILEDATTPNLVRASQAFFDNLPQPFLDPQDCTDNPEGFRQLRFNERLSEFVGRDGELAQLREFTESGEPFSWWHVTGPGLSGKSRLLLEHCLSLEGWHWGWLEGDLLTFPFSDWLPDKNTFIVIDYALGREPEIQLLFQRLFAASQSDRFVNKVRLILIEREYSGWLSAIEHVPNIGNWVANHKYRNEGLVLERLPNTLDAIDDFPAGEFMEAIRQMLQRENQRRWQVVPREAHDALVLATATGGFSMEDLPSQLRPETQEYLDQMDCSEEVARMIGAVHLPHSYEPLQPDVFGELYVLDAIRHETPRTRPTIFQRAYELNASGFTNFLYRCGQSFPDHPSLNYAVSDWSFDDPSRMAYLATFANSLETIPMPQSQRIETYKNILSELRAPSGDLVFIERAIFGKILALFPNNDLRIVPAEIQLRPTVEIEPLSASPDFLQNLLPTEYCSAVIEAWRQLGEDDKTALLGPHLVEIFQHQLLRLLSVRQSDIEPARDLFAELTTSLNLAGGARYGSTIFSFQGLCANVVAALFQYGHNSRTARDWAEEIRGLAGSLSTLERNGQPMVFQSSNLDRIDLGLTVMAVHDPNRDWQYKFERTEAIRRRGAGIQPNDPLKTLHYVQAAVQITSGFSGDDQARQIREVLERCREYTTTINTPQIAEAFAMMLGNLTGYATRYDLGQSSEQLFTEAAELACRFPEPQHGLVKITLNKLGSEFQNHLNSGDIDRASAELSLARRMIEAANEFPHEVTKKLHAGAFVDTPILRYVQGSHTLLDEALQMARFLASSEAVDWRQTMLNSGAFSRYFTEAQRALNEGENDRAIRALQALQIYASIDEFTDYQQVISIIQAQIDG
ncbi:hypothetical protein [uncultured Aliiroseovarius sp.]|uniref:hypothetical protein n=1 Tax=uncultured Aliiroseovarius sp. TaxID=1658783 RepID=UPI0026234860|nr:hypothetical protein [uncultured Aliiroseovarius sp.]